MQNIVNDDFPIEEDGILGMDFLRSEHCTLSFENNELIFEQTRIPFISYSNIFSPPRSINIITLKIKICKNQITDGYVPRINAGDGILYIGECLSLIKTTWLTYVLLKPLLKIFN